MARLNWFSVALLLTNKLKNMKSVLVKGIVYDLVEYSESKKLVIIKAANDDIMRAVPIEDVENLISAKFNEKDFCTDWIDEFCDDVTLENGIFLCEYHGVKFTIINKYGRLQIDADRFILYELSKYIKRTNLEGHGAYLEMYRTNEDRAFIYGYLADYED